MRPNSPNTYLFIQINCFRGIYEIIGFAPTPMPWKYDFENKEVLKCPLISSKIVSGIFKTIVKHLFLKNTQGHGRVIRSDRHLMKILWKLKNNV